MEDILLRLQYINKRKVWDVYPIGMGGSCNSRLTTVAFVQIYVILIYYV